MGASRAVSETVIQPGIERVSDPAFTASVRGVAVEAGRRAGAVGGAANEWGKAQFGVDVADTVGGVVGTVRDRVGGGPAGAGYGSLAVTSPGEQEGSGLYDGADDDDLFSEYRHGQSYDSPAPAPAAAPAATAPAPKKKTTGWDDEWNDF